MQRFYIPSVEPRDGVITLRDERVVYQMNRVLRMRQGSRFSVFDGAGCEWLAEVIQIRRDEVLAQALDPIARSTEPRLEVSLYQAIPKKPALFEWILQKATEIGVSHFYPLITERTEKRQMTKWERLQSIVVEAVEQCGRTRIPVIHHPVVYEEVIAARKDAYLAYEYEKSQLLTGYQKDLRAASTAAVFIGPEGGFSPGEIDQAILHKARLFSLGNRILRTETAALSSLSLLLLGDLGR